MTAIAGEVSESVRHVGDVARGLTVLAEGLVALGWHVDVVAAYRTVPASVPAAAVASVAHADAVAFASSSAVTNFAAAVPRESWPNVAVAIGPISGATAREVGFDSVVEADVHDIAGLIRAVELALVVPPPT